MNGADAMALVEILDALPPEARKELLARYCHGCGEIQPETGHCHCEDDE